MNVLSTSETGFPDEQNGDREELERHFMGGDLEMKGDSLLSPGFSARISDSHPFANIHWSVHLVPIT